MHFIAICSEHSTNAEATPIALWWWCIIIIIVQHFYSAYRVRGYRGAGGARLSPCEQMSLEISLECLNSTAWSNDNNNADRWLTDVLLSVCYRTSVWYFDSFSNCHTQREDDWRGFDVVRCWIRGMASSVSLTAAAECNNVVSNELAVWLVCLAHLVD